MLGIFLLSPRLKTMVLQVTAFTIAHSITLGLSMYGIVSLPPRIVEPLIALSIAYVAIENLITRELKPWRLALVFMFGLLHGLGFAGVLRELGLPRGEFLTALLTFNLGVEGGQLTIIAAAMLAVRLMAGSSAFEFVRSAHRAGYVTRRELARDAIKNVDFRLRGSTDEAMEAVRVRVAEMIGGVAVRDLLRLAPDVIAGILPRVSRTMLDVAWNHQDAGRRVYICTAASQGVVELLAPVLRFDGAVGTDYEVRDGVYTGGLAGPLNYGEGKATSIRDLAARESIDLDASFAYSDSASDLPMLRAVAYPVAVNPDRELGAIAREEGWEVLRFDRLEAKLKLGAAVLTTAALGSTGRVVVQRRRHRTGPARALRLPRR